MTVHQIEVLKNVTALAALMSQYHDLPVDAVNALSAAGHVIFEATGDACWMNVTANVGTSVHAE